MSGSHFFAYLSKMRWIQRWGMKRNAVNENVMEHSYEVAVIAHALAVIRNEVFGGNIDTGTVTITALFHDAAEVLTGDMPTPIKYHNKKIRDAYKEVELAAEGEMLKTLPKKLQPIYKNYLLSNTISDDVKSLVKAADLITSYLKCQAELQAGNQEFSQAIIDVEKRMDNFNSPELDYFREEFLPSFSLTLDELIIPKAPFSS